MWGESIARILPFRTQYDVSTLALELEPEIGKNSLVPFVYFVVCVLRTKIPLFSSFP